MRLNRYLAACGLGSRRSCEAIITAGRVAVNGKRCEKLATQVDEGDTVTVDGEVTSPKRTVTLILHKPPGYLCTKEDPHGRRTIYDLLPAHLQDLSYVGRLDMESEGLLVMSNDGDLSQTLTHPRFKVEKLYLVALDRTFKMGEDSATLIKGVKIEEGFARAVSVHALSPRRLFVVLNQGYKRQLRQMFEVLDYRVNKLIRLRIGGIELGDLTAGRWQILRPEDIQRLSVNPAPSQKSSRHKKSGRPRSEAQSESGPRPKQKPKQ